MVTPQAVVTPSTVDEVGAVMAAARRLGLPVTFRSGGTSLSGQGGTDGVLLDTRRNFRQIAVLDDGKRVRSGPGATVRAVNSRLARFGTKLGPDPASEIACTVGGVVANNSSGMTCGVSANTYQTLDSSVLVLASGTVIDTSRSDADDVLREQEPALHAGLAALRDRVRDNARSVERIRALFAIKNTMGYAVNAFLDHDRPVDIFERLVIGSEGTLAFVAEATFRTLPLRRHLATGFLIFSTLASAMDALPSLVKAGFAAIELMDTTSLRVAQRDPAATTELLALTVENHAALLVEFQEESDERLQQRLLQSTALMQALPLAYPASMSTDLTLRTQLWHIRKGLFTVVAGTRPTGTTALLEDVAVPVERLGAACEALSTLFKKHGYEDAVIFGHAKDGNIHFMLTERFDDPRSLARYRAFTEQMVALVLGLGGTLKAEHGTGRIMAPFVRQQYGDELYEVMRSVKRLADPDGVLNPGVLISDLPDAHLRNLKTAPPVESEVDRCVECGYCEPVCPSRDITLSPRDRIVLRREIARAEAAGDRHLATTLRDEYQYDGVQTCAVDGMCETACPVLINTGDLVRRLRSENAGALGQAAWNAAAKNWGAVSRVGGLALSSAAALPAALPAAATVVARAALGNEMVPAYTSDLPRGGRKRIRRTSSAPDAVYFSSCTTTMFGPSGSGDGVAESFARLCERAGVELVTPDDLPSLCCGTPWKSKGQTAGSATMTRRVAASLKRATRDGQLPVVCDASSCTEGLGVLLSAAGELGIRVIDAVIFVDEFVLPVLPDARKVDSLTLHPTCSSTRMGITPALERVAGAAADRVIVPDDWGCCAFAGDRGMLHPELTAAATEAEAREVATRPSTDYASLNRTCELGMTRATGHPYRHILEVLDDVTREVEL
jgi:D-lactate dehydrogenase